MKPSIRTTSPRLAAAALAAGIAAFVVPTAANAAVTPTVVSPTQLTVAGDAAADNITLTSNAAGLLTHSFGTGANGLADATDFNPDPNVTTTLQANGTVGVTVNGGDGADNVNLSGANLAPAAINGEGGDDIIVGSPSTDAIDGGAGNDRITGFRNTVGNAAFEPINGGEGNDVMIWNNGDGSDINEGGNGIDETLVTNGTGDDDMTVNANGARTLFHRNNAPFDVDMGTVEKLSITSFAGNDKLVTGPGVAMPMVVDGGPGDDNLSTGDGTDRIVGDRGNDVMNGGGNDDTLVWSNGDGNDVMNGDAGTDRIENNLGAADDVSTLKVENGRVRYDRVNAPFNLSVGSAEIFENNSFGGNDTLTASPGLGLTVLADTGAGDDTTNIREGAPGIVLGGAGNDKVVADGADLDQVAGDVESVQRPAVAGVGTAKLPRTAKVKKGVATIKFTCPAGTSGCNGAVTLFSTKSLKAGRVKAQVQLGRKTFKVAAGKSANVKVKLASGTSKLAKKKKLTVSARVLQGGAERSSKLSLRF